MPGPEDDGYGVPPVVLERGEETGYPSEPVLHLSGCLSAGQHLCDGIAFRVPGILFRDGIVGMPADGHDAAPAPVADDLPAHLGEGNAVQVAVSPEFQSAQLAAQDGGVVAADIVHVAPSVFPFPRRTVEEGVLVTEHHTFLL